MMQRETYICDLHEQNIEEIEKNAKLVKDKEMMLKEN
jgi:hypothetical protein